MDICIFPTTRGEKCSEARRCGCPQATQRCIQTQHRQVRQCVPHGHCANFISATAVELLKNSDCCFDEAWCEHHRLSLQDVLRLGEEDIRKHRTPIRSFGKRKKRTLADFHTQWVAAVGRPDAHDQLGSSTQHIGW